MQPEVIAAIIAAGVAIVTSVITWLQSAPKSRLDVLSTIVDQLQEEVGRLRNERDDCQKKLDEYGQRAEADRKRISELEERVKTLNDGVMILIEQIVQLGETPRWRPDEQAKKG